MMKRGILVAGLLGLAAFAQASDWAVGPRAALGWSQDTGAGSVSFVPEMVYGGGVQTELSLGKHGFADFELAYDQAGRRSVATMVWGSTITTADIHMTEEQVGEALLAGWRFGDAGAWWHPRAYMGYQFTQALDLRQDWSGTIGNGQTTLYMDQDHRYRHYGIVGLGLGLGRTDSVILDFRASQELEHQTGFIGTAVYAKFQFGLTWLYRI